MTSQRRYVVPRDSDLEMQVDTIMRGFQFASYAEMFRTLVRDCCRHLRKQARIRAELKRNHPPETHRWCDCCKSWTLRSMWTQDPHFCDSCAREHC